MTTAKPMTTVKPLIETPEAKKRRAAYARRQAEWRAGCEANYARRAPLREALLARLEELTCAGYDAARLHQAFLAGCDLFGVRGLDRDQYHEWWMVVIETGFGKDCPEGYLKAGLTARTDALRRGTYSEDTQRECDDLLLRWLAAVQVRTPRLPRINAMQRANTALDAAFDFALQRDTEAA